ncbi:MAG TPA: hypothetical protein VFX12_13720 [Vicinamibacterales bacterium]|nr:hypothetical protein [Vicinamibacterales bacterium]
MNPCPVFAVVFVLAMQQSPAPAQATPSGSTAAQLGPADDLPVSLDRIQRALSQPAAITLSEKAPTFRVEVFGKKPTIEDILGPKFWVGPVPYGGMTHQEFMSMVTPKDIQYGAFSSEKLPILAGLALAEQWALRSAIHKYQTAKNEREQAAARKEVLDALAALEKARHDGK